MRYSAIVAMLLLAALHSAHAELVEVQWSADGRFTHEGPIAASKFVEVCGKLPGGVKVRWAFEAGAPVDFNVHHHAGQDVVFPSKLSAVSSGKDALSTKIEQDCRWMWNNKLASPATLSVQFQR